MGHYLSAGGSILRDRLSSYLGRDSDRGFLAVLGALILLWTMATVILFGCGAYQKLATVPQLSPLEPNWTPAACSTAAPGTRCVLVLPRSRDA